MKQFFLVLILATCIVPFESTLVASTPMAVSSASFASDSDVDSMLKTYEQYVNKYIAVMKKMKSGDMSVMTEYAEMMEKYQEVMQKLEKCKDKMTPAQLAKFNKITAKVLEAVK